MARILEVLGQWALGKCGLRVEKAAESRAAQNISTVDLPYDLRGTFRGPGTGTGQQLRLIVEVGTLSETAISVLVGGRAVIGFLSGGDRDARSALGIRLFHF